MQNFVDPVTMFDMLCSVFWGQDSKHSIVLVIKASVINVIHNKQSKFPPQSHLILNFQSVCFAVYDRRAFIRLITGGNFFDKSFKSFGLLLCSIPDFYFDGKTFPIYLNHWTDTIIVAHHWMSAIIFPSKHTYLR